MHARKSRPHESHVISRPIGSDTVSGAPQCWQTSCAMRESLRREGARVKRTEWRLRIPSSNVRA